MARRAVCFCDEEDFPGWENKQVPGGGLDDADKVAFIMNLLVRMSCYFVGLGIWLPLKSMDFALAIFALEIKSFHDTQFNFSCFELFVCKMNVNLLHVRKFNLNLEI